MFKFPAITVFKNSNEIELFEANLNDLFNLKGEDRIKSIELYSSRYNNLPEFVSYGLFYIGEKPSDNEIIEIIKNNFNKNYTINRDVICNWSTRWAVG